MDADIQEVFRNMNREQDEFEESMRQDELRKIRKLEKKMAALKRRLENREKLSELESVDDLEEELNENLDDLIEEDELSDSSKEEPEGQNEQAISSKTKKETRNSKPGKRSLAATPIDASVAMPAMSVANRVDSAKVKVTVGAVSINAGERTTVVKQGGQIKVADDAKSADVEIKLDDVNMTLGSDVRINSEGGGMHLEAVGNTAVNVKAGAQTIKMKDNSKLNVHGVDLKGKHDEALINKGPVDIHIGRGAEVKINGKLPKNLRAFNEMTRKDDDETLMIRVDDNQRVVLEAEDDQENEERILEGDVVSGSRQANKIIQQERLIFRKGPKKCANWKRKGENLYRELDNNILMFDLRGQHDLQTCVCICQACQGRMPTRRELYIKQGFWPVIREDLQMMIDMDLLYLFRSIRSCSKHISLKCYVNVLRHFFKTKVEIQEPSEIFYSVFLDVLDEYLSQVDQ